MDTLDNILDMADSYIEKNGWNEWAKYVLKSLEELKTQYSESENKIDNTKESYIQAINSLQLALTKEIGDLRSELKVIQTRINQRAAVLGVIAGSVPAIIGLVITLIKLGQTI